MEEIQNRKQCEIMLTDTGLSGRQKHWELCIAAQADCLNIFKFKQGVVLILYVVLERHYNVPQSLSLERPSPPCCLWEADEGGGPEQYWGRNPDC